MTTRPTTDGDTKAAIEKLLPTVCVHEHEFPEPWVYAGCLEVECKNPCDFCRALETLTTRLSEQEVELERLHEIVELGAQGIRNVRGLGGSCACGAWFTDEKKRPHAPGCPVERFLDAASALTPTTQDPMREDVT